MARIVFFGNERLATGVTTTAPTLQALIKQGHEVVAVVSHHEAATSRKARTLEIADVAQSHGIPVLLPDKPAEILDQLTSFRADIGVLVAYGKIVPQSIIDVFPHGIINIHPSALPKHRGPTPLESVILSGEPTTAVSVMQLVKAMDAGPVFAQNEVALTGSETKQALADTLLATGSSMITNLLPDILNGSLPPTPQNDADATFDMLIQKQDGQIDWRKPAARIEREIRAFAGWPKSYTQIGGLDIVLTAARVQNRTQSDSPAPGTIQVVNKEIIVGCGEDDLVVLTLIPAGKTEMSAEAFINGYGNKLNLL